MQARYNHNRLDARYDLDDLDFARTLPPLRTKDAALFQGPYRVVQFIDAQTYVVEQLHTGERRRGPFKHAQTALRAR